MDVDLPLISYGTRGMAYMEIEVRGPSVDLHSGSFGGVVDNPFNVLVRLLAQLQDGETRKVLIPGFYDKVRPLDAEEQLLLAEVPFGDAEVRTLTGVPQVAGEAGFTTIERVSVRPTLDIHGIPGGFTQPGKQDRHSCQSDGQGQHAFGARSGAGGDRRAIRAPSSRPDPAHRYRRSAQDGPGPAVDGRF